MLVKKGNYRSFFSFSHSSTSVRLTVMVDVLPAIVVPVSLGRDVKISQDPVYLHRTPYAAARGGTGRSFRTLGELLLPPGFPNHGACVGGLRSPSALPPSPGLEEELV